MKASSQQVLSVTSQTQVNWFCYSARVLIYRLERDYQALAAEGGTGWYLLGSRTEMAGYLPPPGFFAQSTNYYLLGKQER